MQTYFNRISVFKKLVVYSVLFSFAAEMSYAVTTSQESGNALYRRGVDAGLLKSAAEELFENVVEMRKLEDRARNAGQGFQMGLVLTGASDLTGRIDRISFRLTQLVHNISDLSVQNNLSIALQMLENIPRVNLAADRAELLNVIQILLGTLNNITGYVVAIFEGNYAAQISQQLCLSFDEPQSSFQNSGRSKHNSVDPVQFSDPCDLQILENNPALDDLHSMDNDDPFSDQQYENQEYDGALQQPQSEQAQMEQANFERAEQARLQQSNQSTPGRKKRELGQGQPVQSSSVSKAINSTPQADAATGFKEVIIKGLEHFGDYGNKPKSGVETLFRNSMKGFFRKQIEQSWKCEIGNKKFPNVKLHLTVQSVIHLKNRFGFFKGYLVNFNSSVYVVSGGKSKSYRKDGVSVYVDKLGSPKSKNAPFDAFVKSLAKDLAAGFHRVM